MNHEIRIALQPLQGANPAPLAELQPLVWDMLCDYASRFVRGARSVWEDYVPWAARQPGAFAQDGMTLVYTLPADGHPVSAAVAAHWLRASLAAAFQSMSSFSQDHGWLPVDQPRLDAEVWDDQRDVAWLRVGDDVGEFRFDDPEMLRLDDGTMSASDLDEDELTTLRQAVELRRCPCHMCEMLRPDSGFERSMLASLQDSNFDVVQSAIWYLRQTARVSVDTAIAVARAGLGVPRDHAAACHDFGTKLDPDDLGEVLDAIQTAEDDVTKCGLLGLAAGMNITAGSPGIERRLFTFVAALSGGDPVCEVAAEFAGYGRVAEGHEDHFARGLVRQIGRSDEFDHNVALTLFNFYMGAAAVPAFALDAIARLAAHDAEQVQAIAAFAHAQLMSKPTR